MTQSSIKRYLSPFAVLLYAYVAYFAVVYGRFYRYVYWDLMNLGTRIIGAVPRFPTLVLYLFGGLLLIAGFLAGSLTASKAEERDPGRASLWIWQAVTGVVRFIGRLPLVRRLGPGWSVALIGWLIGLLANLTQVRLSGGASLTDIVSRWQQSPVVVFIAGLQILFVPMLVISSRSRLQKVVASAAFVASTLALGVLGARNLPAKLIVATFLAAVIVAKPKNVIRLAVTFLIVLVIAMGIIGAVSKAGIYGASASTNLVVALTYSDSLGTVYNLDKIVALTPPDGLFKGRLLRDSLLSLIPGVDAEYASYQIGRYLGGRSYFEIDGVMVERSVSLAPTMLGAPYADNGILGVAGQMLLLGGLFGYLQRRRLRALWTAPFLVFMASYVINGVNAGIYGPTALFAVAVTIMVVLFDMVIAPAALVAGSQTDEGDGQ